MNLLKFFTLSTMLFLVISANAQTFQGELQILIFDNFEKHTSKTVYQLHNDNETYILNFSQPLDMNKFMSGTKVIIEGENVSTLKQKAIDVQKIRAVK